ncbi:hypothetical protein BV898_14906 [Hypsibius exemplaris]|uniref:Secreted protein n=1 Tax=Hypsibius exemplaris TaxID=2072580 RepID=A0A9X6N9K8_HYPEX|nr:hypothetical protein BV898_14906 [Hypsibius exemplaris]
MKLKISVLVHFQFVDACMFLVTEIVNSSNAVFYTPHFPIVASVPHDDIAILLERNIARSTDGSQRLTSQQCSTVLKYNCRSKSRSVTDV